MTGVNTMSSALLIGFILLEICGGNCSGSSGGASWKESIAATTRLRRHHRRAFRQHVDDEPARNQNPYHFSSQSAAPSAHNYNPDERYYENYYGERAEYDTAADNEYEQDSGEDFARNVESDVNQYEVENQIQAEEAEFATDTEIINKLLNQGYDWRVRPPGTNLSLPGSHGPVVVSVNMLIRSISKIDDVNMEYSVQMTFRETWVDGRLAYGLPRDNKPDFLILTAGQQIWMPDSFFQNEKQATKHMIDKPNVLIRIHKDGTILYSVRISLVLSCPMHLQYYPMDIQTCLIDLASYAYTTEDIEYKWKSNDPVQLKDGLNSSLPSFQLNNVRTTYCTSTTNTGSYSCLRTVLELRRQFSYYLLQLYIPSTMLVIVSWVSFWLDRTAVPARVTLGVTTLLTMTTQASGINAKLPPVSYTKAIDIWIGACLFFIFGALLEFAWVTYVSSRAFFKGNKESKKKSNVILSSQPLQTHLLIANTNALDCDQEEPWLRFGTHSSTRLLDRMECGEVWVKQHNSSEDRGEVIVLNGGTTRRQPHRPALQLVSTINALIRWLRNKFDIDDRAKRADYISRFVFPAFFALFNCLYWLRYSQYRVSVP